MIHSSELLALAAAKQTTCWRITTKPYTETILIIAWKSKGTSEPRVAFSSVCRYQRVGGAR